MPHPDVQVCCPDCGEPWTNRRLVGNTSTLMQSACLGCRCEYYRQRSAFLCFPSPPDLPLAPRNPLPLRRLSGEKAVQTLKEREAEVNHPMTPPLPPQESVPRTSKRRKADSEATAGPSAPRTNIEGRFNQRLQDLEDHVAIRLQEAVEDVKFEIEQQAEEMRRFDRAVMNKSIRTEVAVAVKQTMRACLKDEIREAVKGLTLTIKCSDKH